MNTIHFISGLPRSGTTLLAAILKQNPRFHAGMTSPVGTIFCKMLEGLCRRNEAAIFITAEQKSALCRGVFENYYASIDRPIAFDMNRMWNAKLPAIAALYPDAKVICCVRNVAWIMDSIERLYRSNPLELSGLFGFESNGTVYSRIATLAAGNGLVGFAIDALKEAVSGDQRGRILIIGYEALARSPADTIAEIYKFIGEDLFDHDFDRVEYEASEFDENIGAPGLHKIRSKVEFIGRQTILPKDIFDRFAGDAFWIQGLPGVRVIMPTLSIAA